MIYLCRHSILLCMCCRRNNVIYVMAVIVLYLIFFAAWICQWVNWRRVLHRPDGRARRQSFCLGPEPSASAANRHSALPIGEGSYVGREIHGGMPNDRSAEMASLVLRRMSSLAFGLMARLTVRLAWLWRPVFGQPRSSSARVLSCA